MHDLAPVDDLVVHEEDGECFILHLATGVYYSLNRSGLVGWRALVAGDDPVEALQREFPGTDVEQLHRDWAALLGDLSEQGLVALTPSE